MSVSFNDLQVELLSRSAKAQGSWSRWQAKKQRLGQANVATFVRDVIHEHLFGVSHEQVLAVANGTAHALGSLRTEQQTIESQNATAPFAFHHLFHGYLEKHKRLPTWDEFSDWLYGEGYRFFIQPMLTDMGIRPLSPVTRENADPGLQWRLGCFYLSALREVEAIARLREENIFVKYHVFADTELAVDFWCGDYLFYLRVPSKFEDRKKKPSDFFGRPFKIVKLAVAHQGSGRPWLVTQEAINTVKGLVHGPPHA